MSWTAFKFSLIIKLNSYLIFIDSIMRGKIIQFIRAVCFVSLIMSILTFISSCIRDGVEECQLEDRSLTVSFTYDRNTRAFITFNMDEVKKAVLYIYDDKDDYVTEWSLENPVFNKEYDTGLILDPGQYSMVVWFNPDAPYQVITESLGQVGKTCRSESQLMLIVPDDGCIRDILPPLLHGSIFNAGIEKGTGNAFAIPMSLNNNIINLTVNGLPVNDDIYEFTVSDNNGHYTFDNDFVDCDHFNYVATMKFPVSTKAATNNILNASLTVLKLAGDRSARITLENQTTGQQLYPVYDGQTDDLIDLILKVNPENDFKQTNIYNITLDFNADLTVSITINGWRLKESGNEIL